MSRLSVFSSFITILCIAFIGCGGSEVTEPVPLESLGLYKAEVTKPSALYDNSDMNEDGQFYFLEQGDVVEVLEVLYPGGPALVRTCDGEEGWCPDIAMKVNLMAGTFAAETLAARYSGGQFEETAPGIVGWITDNGAYSVIAAASGDFTGDGKAEVATCEAVTSANKIAVTAYIADPETYADIGETSEYTSGDKGVIVDWIPLNGSGHTAVSLSSWSEEETESPLRFKEVKTTDIWLYDGEITKATGIIAAENVVTVGAASPENISKGDFTGRFYLQRRINTEFVENGEGYYSIQAAEKIILYCYDDQVFEYEGMDPVVYDYDEAEGYVLIKGEYSTAPLTGSQTIVEPARLRRQPAEAGDPIRIIEAEEQVEIITAWPELVETERGQGYWYYVYYQTIESEKEYAGWLFDKYFE